MSSINPQIGRPVLRLEDEPLLRGTGCFVDDLDLSGTAHVAVLRSPRGHALLGPIDTTAALAASGVVDVITSADLAEQLRIPMRMYQRPGMEAYLQPPLARDRVRYSGEPIAVVVAESRYLAEDAAELIEVEYEPLEPVLDLGEALAPEADHLFPEAGTNLAAEFEVGDPGGLDEVFAAAEHVVAERIVCQRHAAVPMEPRGLAAEVDPRTGCLVVYGASKIVHINRRILASLLDLPEEGVRLVELHVGGGFGGRGEFYPEDYLIPFAALRCGRPVKWTADREEELRSSNHSREQLHEIEIALGKQGEFLALRDRITFSTGAYVRTHGTVVPAMTAGLLPGPYGWGAFGCHVRHVVTNKTPAGTYRAPGRYEGNLARERVIDIAAARLGLDPAELRRRNMVEASRMPHANGAETDGHPVVYDSGDYELLLNRTLELFEHDQMKRWREAEPRPGCRRGLGIACFVEKSAIGKWDYARVELNSTGRPEVFAGSASVGQGVETVLAQICAESLGVAYEDVAAVHHGDTDTVPDGMGAFGSRATALAGSAVMQASEGLRVRILDFAGELLEVSADDLEIADGRVAPRGSPSISVSLAEVAVAARPENALAHEQRPGLSEESYFLSEDMMFPYGVHCLAVEIDVETGRLDVHRYAIGYDVGRAVNPVLIDGQIVGGAAQGLGGALLEELAYDPDGQLVTGSFMDYLLPTAVEVPPLRTLVTEDAPTPLNPLGVKGAGEGGTSAAGAVFANAASDALGAEALELPLTPERLVRLHRSGEPTA